MVDQLETHHRIVVTDAAGPVPIVGRSPGDFWHMRGEFASCTLQGLLSQSINEVTWSLTYGELTVDLAHRRAAGQ